MVDPFPSIGLASSREEPPRHRHFRCGEVVVTVKLYVADAARPRRTFDKVERTIAGCSHFDRSAATLSVTLSKVPISQRKERPRDVDRHTQGRALGQLLDVHIAASFVRSDGAHRCASDSWICRYGAVDLG